MLNLEIVYKFQLKGKDWQNTFFEISFNSMFSIRNSLRFETTSRWKIKRWKKDAPCKYSQKIAEVEILI